MQLQQLFSWGTLITNHFSLLFFDRYILVILQTTTHEEHFRLSFWSVAIFWTAWEAWAPWSQQQKVPKTTQKSFSLSNFSRKLPYFVFFYVCPVLPSPIFQVQAKILSFSVVWLWFILWQNYFVSTINFLTMNDLEKEFLEQQFL